MMWHGLMGQVDVLVQVGCQGLQEPRIAKVNAASAVLTFKLVQEGVEMQK
jgi:hypothetical protein